MLILGIAYKRDIDDIRESPALDVMAVLRQKGADISYHDPYIVKLPAHEWPGNVDMASQPLTDAALAAADCVVIVTDHKVFDYQKVVTQASPIVDPRNAVKGPDLRVFKVGAPSHA